MSRIEKKIIGYRVRHADSEGIVRAEDISNIPKDSVIIEEIVGTSKLFMGEHIDRKEVLTGTTYKIKPSTSEHAFYITINNIELDGIYHPFEIFINSKGVEHFKYMALARLISAVFRKGGDVHFIADELLQIYDPVGAYTSKRTYSGGKRKRFNSIEAEIGDIIKEHLEVLDVMNTSRPFIINNNSISPDTIRTSTIVKAESYIEDAPNTGFSPNATLCSKCMYKAVVIMDGCATCLNCGQSKCE